MERKYFLAVLAIALTALAFAANATADDTPAIKLTVLTVQGGG